MTYIYASINFTLDAHICTTKTHLIPWAIWPIEPPVMEEQSTTS